LQVLGVPTAGIELDQSLPTGTVSIDVAADGQPHYQIHSNGHGTPFTATPPDTSRRPPPMRSALARSAAQRAVARRDSIPGRATPPNALRVFDINIRQNFFSNRLINESLAFANVLK